MRENIPGVGASMGKFDRYQYQSWLVRRWRDRFLLLIPFHAIELWVKSQRFDHDEPLTWAQCWSLARGLCDVRRNFVWDWAELGSRK